MKYTQTVSFFTTNYKEGRELEEERGSEEFLFINSCQALFLWKSLQ